MKRNLINLFFVVALTAVGVRAQVVVPNSDGIDARTDSAVLAKSLASKDAIERQKAAEALATLAALDQKKMIEGYWLEEKDSRVKLALDWALFRIGKSNLLYPIVLQLDSGRHDQVVGYLRQLDSPDQLHTLLKREDNRPRVTVGLLEALAQLGNAETLELIKPLKGSFAPGVSAAAESAGDEIEKRLAQGETAKPSRPRTVTSGETPP